MNMPDADFMLDARLAADTIVLADWPLCRVCLMNDARFPWLILVPRRPGVTDIDQLDPDDRALLASETVRAMTALRASVALDKLNTGALGNIVRQLHVHVVARRESDAAWPGPVWGCPGARAYPPSELAVLRNALAPSLTDQKNES